MVHGASGLSDEAVSKLAAIRGVRKINISTELKLAALQGYKEAEGKGFFAEIGFQPVKISQYVQEAVKNKALAKLSILKGEGKG